VHAIDESRARFADMAKGVPIPEGSTSPRPYSVFMDIYAGFCRMHMREFGTRQEHLAAVAAKNHGHSTMNPLSQYQKAFSVEEIMRAAPITFPLTLPMCSPVSDGAAAALLCNEAGLKRIQASRARNMRVLATVMQSGSNRAITDFARHASKLAAQKAYEKAGVGPHEVDVAEVHDATAMGEIIELEAIGLCKLGDGGPAAARGETTLGGRIPVNPSGGLESKGHPIGATGLGQIFELVTQLRGEAGQRQVEGAKIAVAQNGGGLLINEEAITCVTVLGH